ncbi:MAG: M81 family metallopeptidase [Bryobacterales bacterium]|nr:M81 family metallopeptidase [Bryobacterales bacterium]
MKFVPLSLALALFAGAAIAQQKRPLVAVTGMSHESNSFFPSKTTAADFGGLAVRPAADVIRESEKASTMVSGYIAGSREFGFDLLPGVVVRAQPKGPVTAEAFETIANAMVAELRRVLPKIDGVLMPLHGAMVVESYPSGDLELVRRVRQTVGPDMPIVVTHDFHANIDPEIIRHCNVLITFKENPHIDTKERGIQAAKVISATIAGRVKPVQAVVKPPMVYNIVFQHTKSPPLLPIVEESRRLEQDPRILAVSVSGGYQYADVPQMGPSVVVVTDNDPQLAQREAQRLSDMLWATREQIRLRLPDAREAVRQAIASDKQPIALIDMGDNIGGGTAGDSTFLLRELVDQRAQGWVVAIADPEAQAAAFRAGIGQPFDMAVGGKTDKLHGEPVRIRGKVKSMHEGEYIEPEVRHGGGRYRSNGHTAVIEVEGGTRDLPNLLLLTGQRSSPNSLHQLISVGIYPTWQKILVVKGAIAPRAAYEPIAAAIVGVDTPGASAVNPARFTFKKVRRPLFGLE